jgi:iron-sulfur cluster repair protein YtfE (RIC family)
MLVTPRRVTDAAEIVVKTLRHQALSHLYKEDQVLREMLEKFNSKDSWGWTSQTLADHWLQSNGLWDLNDNNKATLL